jgi:FtsP/CotA-like multicopper oxidase with cupredoxin domain
MWISARNRRAGLVPAFVRPGAFIVIAAAFIPSAMAPNLERRATLADPVAIANDNRAPAGRRVGDTLELHLAVGPASWKIFGDSAEPFRVLAFAEEGRAPSIPGPLIRVRAGTPIHVIIRNPLDDTLVVRGLGERGGILDSLVISPAGRGEARFVARREGTYQYWATTAEERRLRPALVARAMDLLRPRLDSQLMGAFVVDPSEGAVNDRIFVITEIAAHSPEHRGAVFDRRGLPAREFTALNGRSWPNTERLNYASGDTIRWRIVNGSFQPHPMHLHGFYFRVDSRSSPRTGVDTIYTPEQRRMAVTELVGIGEAISMVWTPDRPGGWIFHCHLTIHVAKMPTTADPKSIDFPSESAHGDHDTHVVTGMNGMVLGITVSGKDAATRPWNPARRLRLFVQSDSTPDDTLRRFGYALQRTAEPRADSLEHPGPLLVLTRGEPTSIEVVNRTKEPTAVHWHGIELESYYDGAVGWGEMAGKRSPAIRPGSRFEARMTPPRAGTFMYHTHFDELRTQLGGLVGPIVVLEPGERWDPARDLVLLISDGRSGGMAINGSSGPVTKELNVGTTYRLRIANIAVFRHSMWVRVRRDSSLVSWRAVAKDGFALPTSQARVGASAARITSGETADFELTPDTPGELTLEIGMPTPGSLDPLANLQVQGTVRFRVSEAGLRSVRPSSTGRS